MNQAQYIQLGHDDSVKEHHTGHPVKRKWTDSFLNLEQGDSMENDSHLMKAPHTSASVSSSDDTDGTKVDNEDEDEDIKVKRKAQNRAAQRAFRERKERYVKDLEIKIKQVQDNHVFTTNQLYQENHHLRSIICRLEAENSALKGVIPLAASPNSNNNNNNTNNSSDLFASLGLLSPDFDLPSLPPVSVHPPPPPPSSSIPVGYHPIQPTPMAIKPKPLASKPPVPILPQQPQRTRPIIIAKLPTPNNKKASRSSSKSVAAAAHPPSPLPQQQQQQQSQQQEFTFSISTPATLRADTSGKNNQMDPVELIPLYHPDHHGQRSSDKPTAHEDKSPSAIIVRNDDGTDDPNTAALGSFLDGYDAFERLYVQQDQSLFDDNGLALSMIQSRRNSVEPASDKPPSKPTQLADEESLTTRMVKDKKMEAMIKNQKASSGSTTTHDLVDLSSSQQQGHQQVQQQAPSHHRRQGPTSVPSSMVMEDDEKTPIWQKITEHAQNNKFSVDHLVEAVRNTTTSKRKNKLLVDEWELEAMVNDLNYYL